MDELCIYYDSSVGFIPAICSGELKDLIRSEKLNGERIAVCIGVTPKEVTGKQYRIYIDESLYNKNKEFWH